jgi:hypothetical protein
VIVVPEIAANAFVAPVNVLLAFKHGVLVNREQGTDPAERVPTVTRFASEVNDVLLEAVMFVALQDVHVPVKFVITPEVGVPSRGVTKVGDVAKATTVPEPVVE